MENLQEQIRKMSHQLHQYAFDNGIVLEDGPNCYDPYSRGHPYVAPTCHICGIQGHTPAQCQRGYSYTPDCFGMSLAQQHSSCHNNYSSGWPENSDITYRNNSPEISSFSSSCQMQGFRYEEESKNYLPLDESSVQVPMADFDDIEKLTLLCIEFTWCKEDDPLRKVIIEEMKKIKSGEDLMEEVRKIEENLSASGTITSQLELSASRISLDTCEVPTPSHPAEQANKSAEVERSQILEEEEPDLECLSDHVEDPVPIISEDKEEDIAAEDEDKEELPIVIQECAVTGLSNPLDDMFTYDFFATALHCMIPSLKVDLKYNLLRHDVIYPISGIAHIYDDDTYYPHARTVLNDTYHPHASIELTDSYHPHHVLYCYAHIIGYSIDDLEGIDPITCSCCLFECTFRFMLVHHSLHADQVRDDIPWDPGGFMTW